MRVILIALAIAFTSGCTNMMTESVAGLKADLAALEARVDMCLAERPEEGKE